jgi:hypothetical protein
MKNLRIVFKDEQYADFQFVDNCIGELMHYRFEKTPKEISQKPIVHSHSFGNLQEVDTELRALVEKCINVHNIDMPEIPEQLDEETFNRVHEQFHTIDEQFNDDDVDPEFVKTLGDLNNIIHVYEHVFSKNSNSSDYMVVDFKSQPSDYLYVPAFTPVDSRYRELFLHPNRHEHETLSLRVGYNTVGKNMYHAVANNDVELIKKGLIRPQVGISNQTVIDVIRNKVDDPADIQNQGWFDKLEKFIVDNNLQSYIGYKDIMHTHTIQPTYATLIDNENNSSLNWTELLGIIGINRFELL